MKAIVLTTKEKTQLFELINEFYSESKYGSWDAFKATEKRDIVLMPILNDLHILSSSVLNDKGYKELIAYILNSMKLDVRFIDPSELPIIEDDI